MCPRTDTPFFFQIFSSSSQRQKDLNGLVSSSSVLLVSEAPKNASSEKELMKGVHDLSVSSNTAFSNSRERFSFASSRLSSGSKSLHLAFSNKRDRQFPSPG